MIDKILDKAKHDAVVTNHVVGIFNKSKQFIARLEYPGVVILTKRRQEK